ncbi:60S ribosomal eL33 domain-containing protein [Calcarisporiella thermophila]|uniref:60S ribosomal eL33 domain-containing protein n=1 Tax=Calcarisporiella thermophila TaxID=911321 RepID=UPI003742095A
MLVPSISGIEMEIKSNTIDACILSTPHDSLMEVLFNSLYAKGRALGFKRAKRNQSPNTSLVQIENCKTPTDAQFYLGKRVAYVYRAKREVNGSKIRVIWGRVTRTHGTSGVVKAKFRSNLPPRAFGASVRVMLYPSNI